MKNDTNPKTHHCIKHRTARWKMLSVILAVLLMVPVIALPARAERIIVDTPDEFIFTNANCQNYTDSASPVRSYLVPSTDGYMRVQLDSEKEDLLVQYYTPDFNYIRSLRISYELPIFGGFYASKAGNYYVLSGQINSEESDDFECIRAIKYDINWNRLSSMSLKKCNTYEPFRSGSARFAESGDILYIHTCHSMYDDGDGLHHQANMRIAFDMNTMTEIFCYGGVGVSGYGYCSHSFNQFAAMDGDQLVTVDHGDGYPRAISLYKYYGNISAVRPGVGTGVHILDFAGDIGMNYTGASVGGLAVSDSGYLVVGNTRDQSEDASWSDIAYLNIFLAYVPKESVTNSGVNPIVKFQYLTDRSGEESFNTPQIVDLQDGTYLVLWSKSSTVYYQRIDGKANILGPVNSMEGFLSDCQPILSRGKVVWFVNRQPVSSYDEWALFGKRWGNSVNFYTIDPATIEKYVDAGEDGTMYRMYNPNSGEHFYTSSFDEAKSLQNVGWRYEGHAWMAPTKSKTPVYRVYNPNSGEHHYTMNTTEKDRLVRIGWKNEGIGWYSDDSQGTPLYRLYNPNATGQYEAGGHHYTKDVNEKNSLIAAGWRDEGIGWYGK